jgi:serine/threonine-protein kinase
MVGEVIEHYEILQRLGEGGMGTVYRALDTQLEREVALKVLRADLADQPDVVRRFRAEAVALARLSHPHIATIFGLARRDTLICMVMELVRGETLSSIMRREQAMDVERAVRLTLQILGALEYAHESGIVHRDVKPANVIVSPAGVAKVLDFGIARLLDGDRLTQQGLIVGTPQYMAPEQIRAQDVDGRTDVYATAVMLYEMISGRLPFGDAKGVEMIYAHLEGTPRPLTEAAPHTPPWLWTMIQRGMARQRDERLTAAKFRALLDQGLSGTGVPDRTTGPTFALPVPADAAAHSVADEPTLRNTPAVSGTPARAAVGAGVSAAPATPAATPSLQYQTAPLDPPSGAVQIGAAKPANSRGLLIGAAIAGLVIVGAGATWLLREDAAPDATSAASGPAADATTPAAPAPASARPGGGAGASERRPSTAAPASTSAGAAPATSTPPGAGGPASSAPDRPAERARRDADSGPAVPTAPPPPPPPAPVASSAPAPPVPSSTGTALPPASFDDVVLMEPADIGFEEVEVRATVHPERLVVFNMDAGRVVHQVFYKAGGGAGERLIGQPRLVIGSERWFVLPTNTGEVVLRLDLDSSGEIITAFEARSGIKVPRVRGELTK